MSDEACRYLTAKYKHSADHQVNTPPVPNALMFQITNPVSVQGRLSPAAKDGQFRALPDIFMQFKPWVAQHQIILQHSPVLRSSAFQKDINELPVSKASAEA